MGTRKRRQLPYLTLSRHGIYKYRRPIPMALQGSCGLGREFIRSLGTRDPREAKKLWASVNSEYEQCVDREASLAFEGLRRSLASLSCERGPSSYAIAKVAPRPRVLIEKPYTFTDAKWDYVAEKKIDPESRTRSAARNTWLLVERVEKGLTVLLGKHRALTDITRRDAVRYRDQLLAEGKAPRTAKKHIELASAVFQVAIVGRELAKANPFRGLPVEDNVLQRDKRLPLSPEEIRSLLFQRHRMNAELADILTLLVHTGARLAEISGLAIEDYNIGSGNGPASIHIRPNSVRRLKTRSSRRHVPLTDKALRTIQTALERHPEPVSPDAPLFPRYGRSGGSDAASATLMKALRRASINDRRKAIHSIRHSMKDALRALGCPQDIRDAIQGHAQHGIAASYGSGHSMETMHRWLASGVKLLLLHPKRCADKTS